MTSHAVTFTVHEREYSRLRAAADALFGGSVAELVRDALRHRGFAVQARAHIPTVRPSDPPTARPK